MQRARGQRATERGSDDVDTAIRIAACSLSHLIEQYISLLISY